MRSDATSLSAPPPSRGARIKRLKYRAWRRGMEETDLVLGPFADASADDMSEGDLARFEALLEESDADLYAWVAGLAPAPSRVDRDLLDRIRAFAASRWKQGERSA